MFWPKELSEEIKPHVDNQLTSEFQGQAKPATSQRPVFGTTSTESAEPTYTVDSATSNQSEENQN